MGLRIPTLIILFLLLSACDNTLFLSKGTLASNSYYEVKKVNSCCGCSATYYNIYENKRLVQQVVYDYNCPGGNPTKFVFNYNKGKIVSAERYVGVADESYTEPVSEQERKITSSLMAIDTSKTLVVTQVKGYRKANHNDKRHSFPFIKKGYKLPIKTNGT